MPFTFSHPAAILPLLKLSRRWVSVTGLVVGSIVPDFEKFIKMSAGHSFSHTFAGVFLFDLPMALILSFLFHRLVRNTLIDHLPQGIERRLLTYKKFNWHSHFLAYYPQIIISILIGAFSHLFLDSLTHHDGRMVQIIPFLNQYYLEGHFFIYYHKVLDIFLSVIGGGLILFAIYKLPVTADKSEGRNKYRYWVLTLLSTLAITLLRVLTISKIRHIWDWANILIAALLVSLIVSSITFYNKDNNLSE